MMMRKALVLLLVLGLASAATAGPSIVEQELAGSGALTIANDADGAYSVWLEIGDLGVADYAGDPVFLGAGNPNGDSSMATYPDYPGWYEVVVSSFNPENAIVAGEHVTVNIAYSGAGETVLNLYADDGATLLDSATILPEPMSLMLLGLGGLFLRRRK
jgi:hypothetical protein